MVVCNENDKNNRSGGSHNNYHFNDHQNNIGKKRFRKISSFLSNENNNDFFQREKPLKNNTHCWWSSADYWDCHTANISALLSCGNTDQIFESKSDPYSSSSTSLFHKQGQYKKRVNYNKCWNNSLFDNDNNDDDERIGEDIVVVPAKSQEEFSVLGVLSSQEDEERDNNNSNNNYISSDSTILSSSMMDALRPYLPYSIQDNNFWLKYSMIRDGANIRALLQNSQSSKRTILAIETMEGDIIGAFTSSPWRTARGFFGSCEAFVWRLSPSESSSDKSHHSSSSVSDISGTAVHDDDNSVIENECNNSNIEVFHWSGKNCNIQALVNENRQLIIGGGATDDDNDYSSLITGIGSSFGGSTFISSNLTDSVNEDEEDNNNEYEDGGCSLIINNDMTSGSSSDCATFASPSLIETKTLSTASTVSSRTNSTCNEFQIANIEIWSFTPFDTVDEAQKLENGMQFQIDNRCDSFIE